MSRLRAKPPEEIEKRIKLLLYGPAKAGKTIFSLHAPNCYYIDTERGAENAQYVRQLKASGGVYYFSNDLDEITEQVKGLMTEEHPYKWLVIDPVNVPYQADLDSSAEKNVARSGDPYATGMEFGRHKLLGDRKIRHLFNLIYRLDMNTIITAHAKSRWEGEGANRREAGLTFDGYAKMDYIFDLGFEVTLRGADRVARTVLTRHEAFPMNEVLPLDFSVLTERYGKETVNREVKPVEFASDEQVALLNQLLDVRTDGQELEDKWLKKAMADSLAELPKDAADKCIAFLQKGVKE